MVVEERMMSVDDFCWHFYEYFGLVCEQCFDTVIWMP